MSWVIKKSSRQLKTRGLSFNGLGDYVEVTEFPELMSGNMSWEFWFKPALDLKYTGVSEYLSAFLTRARYPDFHYGGIWMMTSEWLVSGGVEFITFPRSYTAGTWYHIVWVKNGLDVSLYENGAFIGSGTLSGEPDKYPGTNLAIGGNGWHGWMNGVISGVHIYNRALSLREIKKLYKGENITKGLVLYLPLDEGRSKVAIDRSGFNNNGILYRNPRWQVKSLEPILSLSMDEIVRDHVLDSTIFGNHGKVYGAKLVDGKSKKALDFDGVDDYVEVPDSPSLDVDELTIALWIFQKSKVNARLVSRNYLEHIWMLGLWNAGEYFYFEVWNEAGTRSEIFYYFLPPLNKWIHLAVTVKNGEPVKAYYNGQLLTATEEIFTGNIKKGTRPIFIGCRDGVDDFFNGVIDEVHIFDRALSPREIKTLYQSYIHPEF